MLTANRSSIRVGQKKKSIAEEEKKSDKKHSSCFNYTHYLALIEHLMESQISIKTPFQRHSLDRAASSDNAVSSSLLE